MKYRGTICVENLGAVLLANPVLFKLERTNVKLHTADGSHNIFPMNCYMFTTTGILLTNYVSSSLIQLPDVILKYTEAQRWKYKLLIIKWLHTVEKIEQKKMINYTQIVDFRNLGLFLYKIK